MPVVMLTAKAVAGYSIPARCMRRKRNLCRGVRRNLKADVISMYVQFGRFIRYPEQFDPLILSNANDFVTEGLTILDPNLDLLRVILAAHGLFSRGKI